MTYVQNDPIVGNAPHRILDPYFQIASQYGYANYMFQTNQGPSFPAHQFLFSGTSAPVFDDGDPTEYWKWFAAENPPDADSHNTGCTTMGETVRQIDPGGNESAGLNGGAPCYDHNSLPTLLDNHVTWMYYSRDPMGKDIWTAPNAIKEICGKIAIENNVPVCNGGDWETSVEPALPAGADQAPVLTDIANSKLQQVSWVIPDGNWSDHSDNVPGDGGPSWVAAIVNAIGQDKTCEGGSGYWSDTVVLVTWDDWGGLYDDVVPPGCQGPEPCTGYSNLTGGQYVYGFRVPLLVVSAYAKPGYISGANVFPPDCKNNTYCHDFGSILNFVEYAFGTGGSPLGGIGGISPSYNYADVLVMDKGPASTPYSLYDFFDFNTFHAFQTINGWKYPPSCFHTPGTSQCFGSSYPQDPDNDANEID
jgi:phospholipase C